jgi:FixJ family two-component response regulator
MSKPAEPVIYVVDDDVSIRETLASLLRSVGLRMEGFSSVAEFQAHALGEGPACLVLDVRLPAVGGLELQRRLNAENSSLPIIFITGHGDIPMSVRAIKAGAVEFLTKPFRDQELLDAIHVALAKDTARLDAENVVRSLKQRYECLTARERQVMALLATGQINKQIGAAIGATESTVKAHRGSIMRKMEAVSLVELIRMMDRLSGVGGKEE